jgi:acyl-CoA dehydrogenase
MATHGSPFAARRRFAQIYVAVVAAQARAATTVRALAEGRAVGPNSSVDKLLFAKAEKDINDLIMDVRRDWMIAGVAPATTSGEGVGGGKALNATRAKWWYTRAATIMGGSAEVQRGIIADHLLGLPKEKR